MSHRPTVVDGTRHAVSAGHDLAASAAFSILEAGGNAIDAGCAAGIALGVLQPDLVNVAGVAPIMIRLANGQVESIAGLGWWPRNCRPTSSCASTAARSPTACCALSSQPRPMRGSPRCGATARCASPMSRRMRSAMPARASRCIRCSPSRSPRTSTNIGAGNPTPRIFCPAGACRSRGRSLVQSDLARTLQYMADQDRAAGPDREAGLRAAHDAFYRGDIAHEIVRFQQREGGYLSLDDLAEYQSRIEPVVRRPWRRP